MFNTVRYASFLGQYFISIRFKSFGKQTYSLLIIICFDLVEYGVLSILLDQTLWMHLIALNNNKSYFLYYNLLFPLIKMYYSSRRASFITYCNASVYTRSAYSRLATCSFFIGYGYNDR